MRRWGRDTESERLWAAEVVIPRRSWDSRGHETMEVVISRRLWDGGGCDTVEVVRRWRSRQRRSWDDGGEAVRLWASRESERSRLRYCTMRVRGRGRNGVRGKMRSWTNFLGLGYEKFDQNDAVLELVESGQNQFNRSGSQFLWSNRRFPVFGLFF